MKRTILSLVTVFALLFPQFANATNLTFITFTVQQTSVGPSLKIDPIGERSLSGQLMCTISEEDGVSISSVDTEDIVSFEISSAETNQVLASFTAVDDFVDYLFTNPGEYLVTFTTDDYIYSGYIEL